MSYLLVDKKVMTSSQRDGLLQDPTERNVAAALTASMDEFAHYWIALGNWFFSKGSNLNLIKGTNTPGRSGGNPRGVANRAIYNDTFNDTNKYIMGDSFKLNKSISNQLRFISLKR